MYNKMKECAKCKVKKDLYEFNKNKTRPDGYQNYCKACKKSSDKIWYENNPSIWKNTNSIRNIKIRTLLSEFRLELGGKCKNCGEGREHLLDFHHLDPKQKDTAIGSILYYYGYSEESQKRAREELKKCVLLCANCHRHEHFLQKI